MKYNLTHRREDENGELLDHKTIGESGTVEGILELIKAIPDEQDVCECYITEYDLDGELDEYGCHEILQQFSTDEFVETYEKEETS